MNRGVLWDRAGQARAVGGVLWQTAGAKNKFARSAKSQTDFEILF